MNRHLTMVLALAGLAASAAGAELYLDFGKTQPGETPAGFKSLRAGEGPPGEWKVVLDDVPTTPSPLTTAPSPNARRSVLAQLSRDKTDERFPMLVYEGEIFTDFTVTTRFKTVAGETEQMAGIAFRIQDERNYCYVRASALGGTFSFYEVVQGQRRAPVGNKMAIAHGVWHELSIECSGSQFRFRFDGQEALPPLQSKAFPRGKIGFWTKSDSVSYFYDTRITYKPQVILAQRLVEDTMKKYGRLVEVTIFATTNRAAAPTAVASSQPKKLGQAAPKEIADVLANDRVYYGKDSGTVAITMPLRDRNGESAAAVRIVMKSFPGQTEKNAVARAAPIVKGMEPRIQGVADLLE